MKRVKIKRLNANATIPSYITEGSAGLDLTAVTITVNDNCYEYSTGITQTRLKTRQNVLGKRQKNHE